MTNAQPVTPSKKRLLVLQEPDPMNGVTYWRLHQPLNQLSRMYHDLIEVQYNTGYIQPAQFMWADVVLSLRPHTAQHYYALVEAKKYGCKVILDYDDDLTALPMHYPMFFEYNRHDFLPVSKEPNYTNPYIMQSLELADVVWASTPELQSSIQHNTVHLVPNAIDISELPNAPAASGELLRVVWRGSFYHDQDVYAHQTDFEKMIPHSRWVWMGWMPCYGVEISPERQILSPGLGTMDYFAALRKIAPNVVWKPLVDCKMNRAKSNIAWIEATMCGGVCVGGLSDEKWKCTLNINDITDKAKRNSTWEKSMRVIAEDYNIEKVNKTRLQSIQDA